ncbi:copper amine oxidase N-terminal domain-containing protein [Paenibacillus sp. P96]|uniref:Copper amine oxidase N-terminal domain-containing protein n=1 Tax=Paenibacillus zeirhizosphaerae TaxID=2987519 RepID=A0ABT9FN13_9BACL|nr:copper amine oxidase N-terminal domain-containing protein [Paenibacillus sp. P96]MDP4096069.1 copper amine oxidase N-terminal domain-containing protein [Paenibacillus sp. P96]
MSDKIRHKEKNIVSHDIQGGEKKVMTKFNKKMINVLATATLVAGVAAPVAALTAPTAIHAAGGGEIKATNTPTVSDGGVVSMGSVTFTVPEGTTLNNGDEVVIKLDYDLATKDQAKSSVAASTYNTLGTTVYDFSAFPITGAGNGVSLTANGAVSTTDKAKLAEGDFSARVAASDRIVVTYNGTTKEVTGDPAKFTLRLGSIWVDEGENDDAEVSFEASSSSVFPAGKATVAKITDSDDLNLAFSSLDTSNNRFTPKIVLEEPKAGAFSTATEVKVKLPSGYSWTSLRANVEAIYGDADPKALKFDTKGDNGRELVITYTSDVPSKKATKFEIPFDFEVDDSSSVKTGDITASISGKTSTNVTSAKIGTYGDYGSTLSATDAPTITAGKDEQEVADIKLTETIGESLVNGRTLELTLPEGAAWQPVYKAVYEDAAAPDYRDLAAPGGKDQIKDEGVTLKFAGYTGTDRRTAKYTVTRSSSDTDEATLEFEDVELALASNFTGDVKVTVGGNAGVEGEVVVAKAVAPITAAASNKPNVIIGATNQTASSFTLTEGQAEALEDDGTVILDLPNGVYFTSTPKVEVTSGDAKVSNVRRASDDNRVLFTIDSDSTAASTITVSGVAIDLDRTVPEGDITLDVRGSAVSETEAYTKWADNDAAAKVAIAAVSTPAPDDQNLKTVFTVNSTSYSVNGETRTADVAPYIENSRTYLPVRYVADALGVGPKDILFDKATSTVTLIKGDRVAQIKLNTNKLTINGTVITMDVKAVTKNNRTMLPMSFVAQALGATVNYDATAKTVTVSQK